MVRTPATDLSVPLGSLPSSKEESRERPLQEAQLHKRGPFSGRRSCPLPAVKHGSPGRPARIANHMTDKALTRSQSVRKPRCAGALSLHDRTTGA